ncbi:MAG: sialate O-acetylesterase [Clostridiales bacterium]|nr:sialate O-acetylesterase [Clostridiales bacterium]
MGKTRGKFFIAVLVAVFIFLLLPFAPFSAKAAEKSIDVYLIAGQSNAAGYSAKGRLNETFQNVYYAGEVDLWRQGARKGTATQKWLTNYKKSVTAGYGRTSDYIGPEYGIAKVLNESYSAQSPALIFKSAAGGTSLRNESAGQSADYGNWYPRSLWTREVNADTSPMGVQYNNFVENFKTVYNQLKSDGFAVHVKGMAWMQGEADLGRDSEYETLLKTFIADMRADLQNITGDDTLTKMPFVIGEIATTFETYNNEKVPSFIGVQRRIALDTENVYSVRTDDLTIVNASGAVVGTDKYHFNTQDAVTLGSKFGKALAVAAGKSDETLGSFKDGLKQPANGAISYTVGEDQRTVEFTVTPNDGYQISRFYVDGNDVIGGMNGDKYLTTWRENMTVSVVTVAKPKPVYTLSLDFDKTKGKAFLSVYSVAEGNPLTVTVTPDDAYEVESVTFNGEALRYDGESGRYVLDAVTASGAVKVTFKGVVPKEDGDESGWIVPVCVVGGVVVLAGVAAAIAIPLVKKRRQK